MPPAHIFIARHGERMDHVDPSFGKTYARPHDSPLTPNGVAMAEALGAYLVQHYDVDPSNTVILTSPLTRCVQTSHGIAQGAQQAAGSTAGHSIPIYLEPSIMEGAYWIFYDMKQNPNVVDPATGAFHCPEPVYYDAAHHRSCTSPQVQLDQPFLLCPPPTFTVEMDKLEDHSYPERCHAGPRALLTQPQLDGKTVVLVAHGDTVIRALYALTKTEVPAVPANPAYTAFVHATCQGSGAEAVAVADARVFTAPHLPAEPKER